MSKPFVPAEDARQLTRDEIKAELVRIDMTPGTAITRCAEQFAADYPGEGRDLLQTAIVGALTTRTCREGVSGERFLAGIMRSIASTHRRARERRGENVVSLPVEVLAEQMAMGGYTVMAADDVIEIERVRLVCEHILDQLSAASPRQAALIDGIGLGLRGQALADHLGLSMQDLATVRRTLKRHAQRLWIDVDTQIFRSEASAGAQ